MVEQSPIKAGSESARAVIILSGGLDSTTCMGMAHAEGFELWPLTFDYGQRHRIEIEKAKQVATHYEATDRHRIVRLDFLKQFGASALTDESIPVPDVGTQTDGAAGVPEEAANEATAEPEIPVTYVPGRNMLFLSVAASYAESIGAEAVYIGVNALDYSGYPDCRPAFIAKMQEAFDLATKAGAEGRPIRIRTPLEEMSKSRIITEGMKLAVPYELTISCYNGTEPACGRCDSCRLRLKGFAEAGQVDPIPYVTT